MNETQSDETSSRPCGAGEHGRCYPMGNPEHGSCWCPCHEDWE